MLFAGDESSGYGGRSIEKEKEKEKKKPQTFLLHSVCVCVCGDKKTKQCFGWKEREENAGENQPKTL